MEIVHYVGEGPLGHGKEKQKDSERPSRNSLLAEALVDQHVSSPAQNEKETWVWAEQRAREKHGR